MMWGKRRENGIWIVPRFPNQSQRPRRRFWLGHADTLVYAALGRVRFRLMKPCHR